jgi:hypothetical protein
MESDQDDSGDRRRGARIPVNAEFASMPSATFISDLSEYGVFVHTTSPAPRGTKLRLRFTVLLDDPVIVECEGRVVRQQYQPVSGMGIEFTDLSPEMILRINDVISRQRPLDLGPPLARDEDDTDTLEAARTLTRGDVEHEDPIDTAQTLRRDEGAAPMFAPPKAGGADENAKTGLYQPVEGAVSAGIEDPDAEQ